MNSSDFWTIWDNHPEVKQWKVDVRDLSRRVERVGLNLGAQIQWMDIPSIDINQIYEDLKMCGFDELAKQLFVLIERMTTLTKLVNAEITKM